MKERKYSKYIVNSIRGFIRINTTCFKQNNFNYIGTISFNPILNNLFASYPLRVTNRVNLYNIKTNNIHKVVILLESPHIKEFMNKSFVAPALGKTGDGIQKFLASSIINGGNYTLNRPLEVYIVNAVSNQCSLGYPTRNYRSKIFNSLFSGWNRDFYLQKNKLIRTINFINPDHIIVATTSFCKNKLVKFCINNFDNKSIHIASSHPSIWNANTTII